MRRPRSTADDGATLVELLTVLAISAVVLGFVTATVVNALSAQRRQSAQVAALNDAKIAFERVTRDVRAADPLRVAALDRIRLDVRDPGGAVHTVTYERNADRLVATDGGASRDLVGDLVLGEPLFVFHLADGSTATGEQVLDPRNVRAITVHLRVEPDDGARVVDLENRILLRNAAS